MLYIIVLVIYAIGVNYLYTLKNKESDSIMIAMTIGVILVMFLPVKNYSYTFKEISNVEDSQGRMKVAQIEYYTKDSFDYFMVLRDSKQTKLYPIKLSNKNTRVKESNKIEKAYLKVSKKYSIIGYYNKKINTLLMGKDSMEKVFNGYRDSMLIENTIYIPKDTYSINIGNVNGMNKYD